MKKTYLVLFLLAGLLLWFVLSKPSFAYKARPHIVDLFKLPLKAVTKGTDLVYHLSIFQNRYEERIEVLEKRIAVLTKMAVEKKELVEENQRLRGLLSFKSRLPAKSIAAEVIGRSSTNLETFIIIDKGRSDGITPNMTAAKNEGLIGRILEAGNSTAKVMLIDDPNSRVGAIIQRTREQGMLIGLGGGLCKIIYLSDTTDVKPGDIVVTSEQASISQKGMLIGEVERVVKSPQSLYTSAIVRPYSNLFKIEEVLCIE